MAYASWAAFVNKNYFVGASLNRDLISPFYSPCLTASCVPGSHPPTVITWWEISPALLILIFPLGFRMTCYYYRKAYYRSFWLAPPACAVSDAHGSYTGESRFPLLLQNVHRYFFYFGLVFNVILTIDAIVAFRQPGTERLGHQRRHRGARASTPPCCGSTHSAATPAATCAAAASSSSPRRPSGTRSGRRSPRSTGGTCCSPG